MNHLFSILLLLCSMTLLSAQSETNIVTEDIPRFWEAYDQLPNCKTTEDSIAAFQTYYIDKATEGLQAFISSRGYTAKEYVYQARRAPKYWASIRANTLAIEEKRPELEAVYADYKRVFPDHIPPKVCFGIGALRSAGTVQEGYILIGTEMVATDVQTVESELTLWQRAVLPDTFEVRSIIAHEYVHALQDFGIGKALDFFTRRTLFFTLIEGSADFLAKHVTGGTINEPIHQYGLAHEDEVWTKFKKDVLTNKHTRWVYNGGSETYDFPADMGYFVGSRICESYYEQASDKAQAITDILELKHMKRFYKRSGYIEAMSNE
ncbi:MAG: DUF2268 domain-containing putative Zn-dependent protease [Bacteroidota bacterium]